MKIYRQDTGWVECTVGELKKALENMPDSFEVVADVFTNARYDTEEMEDGACDIMGVEVTCDDPDEEVVRLALYTEDPDDCDE